MATANTPYPNVIRLLSNGEAVDAPTTNRPLSDLAQQGQSLNQRLSSLESGQLLRIDGLAVDQYMADGVTPLADGTPVYLGTDNVLHPAFATTAGTVIGGTVAASGFVFGVVIQHQTPTLCSVAVNGRVLTTVAWAQAIDNATATPGHYFLSTVLPGKLTLAPGSLALYVGQLLPDGTFSVRIQPPQRGEHVHYEFTLNHVPATATGTDPAFNAPHLTSSWAPSTSLPGWLPATSGYFPAGTAIPAGAYFGYNLQHPSAAALAAVFPPIPLGGAVAAQSGLLIDDGRILVNQSGIWWMTNSYGRVPWPVTYFANLPTVTGVDLEFWYSRVLHDTAGGIVTSLTSHPASLLNLKFLNSQGTAAQDGALLVRVDSLLTASSTTATPGTSIKSITGNQFVSGPSVDQVIAGTGVAITQVTGQPGAYVISAGASGALQGQAAVVNLQNAREDTINDTQVVVLPAGRTSQPIWSFEISNQAPASSALGLNLWLYSSVSGTIPSSSTRIEYRIISPAGATAQAMPTGWTLLADLATTPLTANSYALVNTTTVPGVVPGAIVLIRITRNGITDGLTGNIGFVRVGFTLQ